MVIVSQAETASSIARHIRCRLVGAVLGLGCLGVASNAGAHIILVSDGGPDTPKDFQVMTDNVGDPQKPTPCGGAGTPTNIVTTFQAGETITVTWVEAILHSGHFRIVLANTSPGDADAGVLPDPVVTQYTDDNQEAVAVQTLSTGAALAPGTIVLADNLFPHCMQGDPCDAGPVTDVAGTKYSTTVTLPTTPCVDCTLQLVQFMSFHTVDPSFFYHHCAAVTIVAADGGASGATADAAVSADAASVATSGQTGGANSSSTSAGAGASGSGATGAGGATGGNGGASGSSQEHSSGGCSMAAGAASFPAALTALAFAIARRRRAARDRSATKSHL